MSVPTFEELGDNGEVVRYWFCPVRYVPPSVVAFLNEYEYCKAFPSVPMPRWDDLSQRWKAARTEYERVYADAVRMRMEKR